MIYLKNIQLIYPHTNPINNLKNYIIKEVVAFKKRFIKNFYSYFY